MSIVVSTNMLPVSVSLPMRLVTPVSAPAPQDKQHLCICGPDGSKVGTDFNVSMAVIMEPTTSKAAFCFPQAPWRFIVQSYCLLPPHSIPLSCVFTSLGSPTWSTVKSISWCRFSLLVQPSKGFQGFGDVHRAFRPRMRSAAPISVARFAATQTSQVRHFFSPPAVPD